MIIYVSEYFIYWGSIFNLFFVDYFFMIILIVEVVVIDNLNYCVMYKIGVFNMFVIFFILK